MRRKWSGDAGLNDGKLSLLYEEYKERLAKASTLGLDERRTPLLIEADLNAVKDVSQSDLLFLHPGNSVCVNISHVYLCVYIHFS